MIEPQVLNGPTVEAQTRLVYEITLPSGMIVTSPEGSGEPTRPGAAVTPYVTDDGRILSVETYLTYAAPAPLTY